MSIGTNVLWKNAAEGGERVANTHKQLAESQRWHIKQYEQHTPSTALKNEFMTTLPTLCGYRVSTEQHEGDGLVICWLNKSFFIVLLAVKVTFFIIYQSQNVSVKPSSLF